MWLKLVATVAIVVAITGLGYACSGEDLAEPRASPETAAPVPAVELGVQVEEGVAAPAGTLPKGPLAVSALGRLEPEDGIVRVAGPSDMVVVVSSLLVDEGDRVKAGQLIATLDTASLLAARIERIEAELDHANREYSRSDQLTRDQVLADSERDRWESEVAVLEAERRLAEVELARASVYAPISGQVLAVHTWPGERVGEDGIIELAKTHRMYAIAEVYETDIVRVHEGQRATISSPALPEPLTGTVEWISLKVAKQDALGTDPAARKDARVVEVEIRLDDSHKASGLTHLQVEVLIEPSEASG